MRSLAILVFIAGVAAAAVYVARRPTRARGSVLAEEVLDANPGKLRSLVCDDPVEIGVDGARFGCEAELFDGSRGRLQFHLLRDGQIKLEP